MTKMKLLLPILATLSALIWHSDSHAFVVSCYQGPMGGSTTFICETSWNASDVVSYNSGVVNTIGITFPPYPTHSGQLIANAAIVWPGEIVHFLAHRPIEAFYVLSQQSIFSGRYRCYNSETGEITIFPFSHTLIDDFGGLLSASGSGGIVGQGN